MKPNRDKFAWHRPGLRVLWCLVLAGLFDEDRAVGRITLYDGSEQMAQSTQDRAIYHREAFLSWARRAAVPLPASPEEPLGERAQAALDRMLAGKRFVFLGEPDHFILEKYPFRLLFIQYLLQRGWRHVGMETGRSVGWRVDRYLETGDTSDLSTEGAESPNPMDQAIRNKILEFVDAHEFSPFFEQLRQISERRVPGAARLHYWGYDLDLGIPLGSVKPIQRLLEGRASSQVQELLSALDRLKGLSTDEQLTQIEAIQNHLTASADILPARIQRELQSWLAFLRDSVAAEKRPRQNQDSGGNRRWWAQREHFLMQFLDAIVDGLSSDDKLILLGHDVHLSKDAANLHLHPQFSCFWGALSWLRAWGYKTFFTLAGWPTSMGDSVGAHLHRRFPGQVLSVWMLYGQGSLMTEKGPRTVRLHGDTVESLLAQVGDRFLLPLNDVDPPARAILSHANIRLAGGSYASTDLTAQADALYFVREVNAQ
jgi:erythromycin esterase-like protein